MVKDSQSKAHQQRQEKNDSQSKWVYIISGSILATAVACYFLIPSFQQFTDQTYEVLASGDHQRVSDYMKQFGFWGPALIVVTMVVQMFLIVVPSWLLMIVAVLAYGPVWGAVLSMGAVFVASTIGYFLGKSLSEVTIDKVVGKKTEQKMEDYIDRYGFGAVVIFRLAPFLSNDAISIVGGMLRMGYWRFIGATLAGIIPLAALIGYFGQDTDKLKSGLMWIGGASLLLYGIYIAYEQWKKKKD